MSESGTRIVSMKAATLDIAAPGLVTGSLGRRGSLCIVNAHCSLPHGGIQIRCGGTSGPPVPPLVYSRRLLLDPSPPGEFLMPPLPIRVLVLAAFCLYLTPAARAET